jgi:hypothetical protein
VFTKEPVCELQNDSFDHPEVTRSRSFFEKFPHFERRLKNGSQSQADGYPFNCTGENEPDIERQMTAGEGAIPEAGEGLGGYI